MLAKSRTSGQFLRSVTGVSMNIVSPALVFGVKLFSRVFYRVKVNWITPKEQMAWDQIRLVVVLNHTSLFEPLLISAIPNKQLWRATKRLVVPVADVTMNRPVLGRIFHWLAPNAVPITRKRDDSWTQFMEKAAGNSLILIFPEGRMKRRDGFDRHGHPMSVKGGVADVLKKIDHGKMVIAYSGGLHHVQAPGDRFPKLFKNIGLGIEQIDIARYKRTYGGPDFRTAVIHDLEDRLKLHCSEVAVTH